MNNNQSGGEDLTANRISDPHPGSVSDSRTAWHCPAIAIINVKRTTSGPGSYFDGVGLSTS